MLTHAIETHVPVYTLEQTSIGGNKQFEIIANKGCVVTPQQRALFFVPHRRDYYTLVLARRSSSRHWVDMIPYSVKQDTFYFSSPQQLLLKEETKDFDGVGISFTAEFLGMEENRMLRQLPIIQNPHNKHELLLTPADLAFIDNITARMIDEYQSSLGWRNGMLLAYLRVLLIYVSRLYTEQFAGADGGLADRQLLKKFTALIADHFTNHHDVATYASMLNLSPGHCSEMIKEQSGKTAIEHIHDRLLLEAKRMLFHTDQSVKEIAFRLGFEDASYFNRFFKRLTSETPLTYRTNIREMYH